MIQLNMRPMQADFLFGRRKFAPAKGRRARLRSSAGQGISEYAYLIGFTAAVIAMVFMFGQGTLSNGVSQTFSTVNQVVETLAAHPTRSPTGN